MRGSQTPNIRGYENLVKAFRASQPSRKKGYVKRGTSYHLKQQQFMRTRTDTKQKVKIAINMNQLNKSVHKIHRMYSPLMSNQNLLYQMVKQKGSAQLLAGIKSNAQKKTRKKRYN